MWVTSINLKGPYNQRREWADHRAGPYRNYFRDAIDAAGLDKGAPVWATPGLHQATTDVYQFKYSIPEQQFLNSISPYWSEGRCGEIFRDGMRKLREHFVWVHQSDGTYAQPKSITPEVFIEILASMRDAIPPDEDHATFSEVEEARQRYATSLQEADEEPGIAVLEALQVAALLSEEGKTSTSSSGGLVDIPTIRELTDGGSTTNKQKLQQPPPSTARSSGEGPPKRLRLDEEGTSGGDPSAKEIDDQSAMQSNPSTSKGNPRLRRGKGRSLKGGRKSKSSKK